MHLLAQLQQNSVLHCLEAPAFSCTLVRDFNNCGFTIIHFISLRYFLIPHFLAFLSQAVPRRLILNKKIWTNIILYNSYAKPLGCRDGSKSISSAGNGSALYGRYSVSFRHAEFLQSCIWLILIVNLTCLERGNHNWRIFPSDWSVGMSLRVFSWLVFDVEGHTHCECCHIWASGFGL